MGRKHANANCSGGVASTSFDSPAPLHALRLGSTFYIILTEIPVKEKAKRHATHQEP
jgi:hypothetical protein